MESRREIDISSSITHDALVPAVCRWLDQQHYSLGCIEPGRPTAYRGACWPSADVWAVNPSDIERSVSVDIKVSKADSDAQLRKAYVLDPKLGVGWQRYIAAPEGLAVTVPDGHGLLVVSSDGLASEATTAVPYRQQNWRAEMFYLHRSRPFSEPGAASTSIQKQRGLAAQIIEALPLGEAMTAAQLARVIDDDKLTWWKIHKALRGCPQVEREVRGGKTWYMRSAS